MADRYDGNRTDDGRYLPPPRANVQRTVRVRGGIDKTAASGESFWTVPTVVPRWGLIVAGAVALFLLIIIGVLISSVVSSRTAVERLEEQVAHAQYAASREGGGGRGSVIVHQNVNQSGGGSGGGIPSGVSDSLSASGSTLPPPSRYSFFTS